MTAKSVGVLLLLSVLACAGNTLQLSLFFGVDLLFGSIFILLILQLFGFRWALAVSVLASSATFLLWHHPYAMIVFMLESVLVGFLYREKLTNLVLMVALFWLCVGMPLVGLFYHYALHMNATATLTIMLKDAVNGIFNALIASFVSAYLPAARGMRTAGGKAPRSFHDILFVSFIALIVFPLVLVMILFGWEKYHNIDREIQQVTERQSEVIHNDILSWRNNHVAAVTQLSKLAAETSDARSLQLMANHLTQVFPDFHNMYVADPQGTTVAFYPDRNKSGSSTVGLNFSDRPYFKQMKQFRQPVISDVFTGRGGVTEPIVVIGSPVIRDGQFRGVVVGSLNLRYISERTKQLTNHLDMDITIVDRSRHVIASTRSDLAVMQPYRWENSGEVQPVKNGLYHWFPAYINNPMMRWEKSSFIKVMTITDETAWTIIVESSVAPYRDALYFSYIKILLILLLFAVIAIITSIILSRSIVRPISRLAETTTDLPSKMLGSNAIQWPVSALSEMALLIANFKTMAERLQKMFGEIRYLAYYDSLTGLPNRTLFRQELKIMLARSRLRRQTAAVLFIDLDRFKVINDSLGHGNGDLLLQLVGDRLDGSIDGTHILSRMGGDEFTAVLPNLNREQTAAAAQQMLNVFDAPFLIGGHEVFVTPSIGISMYPDDGSDDQVLLKNADQAMYAAKEKGKNMYQFYVPGMDEPFSASMLLDTMLHKALDNREFELYYQPKVNIATDTFSGLEALVRWRHPEKGWIPPAEFIPVAEETGLILPLGEWVLRTACAQNKAWQDAGHPPFSVSVNLSVRQFREQNLMELIPRVLRETGLEPKYLEVEITENLSMHNLEYVLSILHEIKRLGVKIAMDDFGTGYSSLSYLKKFPIDHLKIDQSFIRDIQHHPEDRSIVQAIIAMAHSLGMIVIAEGVETEMQASLLRELQCDEIQGYLLSQPFPPDRLGPYLEGGDFPLSAGLRLT